MSSLKTFMSNQLSSTLHLRLVGVNQHFYDFLEASTFNYCLENVQSID